MFRPQFQYGTPPGFKDVPFVRPVCFGQDPSGGVAAGEYLLNYIVQLGADAPQLFRSLSVQGADQGQVADFQCQIRDAYGNYLTDGFVPLSLLAWTAGSAPPNAGSGRCKMFEPELFCPAGSCLIIDFFQPDAIGNDIYSGLWEFRGIKRYPEGCQ